MLLRWYIGRMFRRNMERDIYAAENEMRPESAMGIARYLLRVMAQVDRTDEQNKHKKQILVRELQRFAAEATANRHAAIARGAKSFSDPAWCAASLSEGWLLARLAAENHKISLGAFDLVDAVAWKFINRTLPAQEIGSIVRAA